MTDFDLKVSKPDFDVLTTAQKNLVFDSSLNQLKVFEVLEDSFSVTSAGSTKTFTIPHNQGVIPAYYLMIKSSGSRWWGAHGADAINGMVFWTSADATNIILKAHLQTGREPPPQTIGIKVYVLVDKGTDTSGNTETSDQTQIKVSIPDTDVKTANDQGLNLATVFETLQVREIVELTVQGVIGYTTWETSVHNLGFTPAWFALVTDNATNKTHVAPFVTLGNKELSVYTTPTNVVALVGSIDTAYNCTFRIALLNNDLE